MRNTKEIAEFSEVLKYMYATSIETVGLGKQNPWASGRLFGIFPMAPYLNKPLLQSLSYDTFVIIVVATDPDMKPHHVAVRVFYTFW